jgi:hypothetical protein
MIISIVSGFAVVVGRIGRIQIFSLSPSKILFLVISMEEASDIRDEVTDAFQEGASAAIKEYGIEGHPNQQYMRDIQSKTKESIPANRQLFEAGEFGMSLVLTGVAILSAFFGIGGKVSIILALITGLLIWSVAVRISLINHLAYQEVPTASFSKLISVWFWNEKVLGEGFPLLYLLIFRFAKSTYEPFYNLCLDVLAKSAIKSVQNPEIGMARLFWREIRSPFKEMAIELYKNGDAKRRESTVDL